MLILLCFICMYSKHAWCAGLGKLPAIFSKITHQRHTAEVCSPTIFHKHLHICVHKVVTPPTPSFTYTHKHLHSFMRSSETAVWSVLCVCVCVGRLNLTLTRKTSLPSKCKALGSTLAAVGPQTAARVDPKALCLLTTPINHLTPSALTLQHVTDLPFQFKGGARIA